QVAGFLFFPDGEESSVLKLTLETPNVGDSRHPGHSAGLHYDPKSVRRMNAVAESGGIRSLQGRHEACESLSKRYSVLIRSASPADMLLLHFFEALVLIGLLCCHALLRVTCSAGCYT